MSTNAVYRSPIGQLRDNTKVKSKETFSPNIICRINFPIVLLIVCSIVFSDFFCILGVDFFVDFSVDFSVQFLDKIEHRRKELG